MPYYILIIYSSLSCMEVGNSTISMCAYDVSKSQNNHSRSNIVNETSFRSHKQILEPIQLTLHSLIWKNMAFL